MSTSNADNTTAGPPTAKDVPRILRMLGDKCAREYAVNAGEDLKDVRSCKSGIIGEEWKDLIVKGIVPKGLLMREFKMGWRDSHISVLHGTAGGYNQGCRCKLCKKAIADYHRQRNREKRDEATRMFVEKFNVVPEVAG